MYRKRIKKPEQWNPPAPSTVYLKIENIPYETFKTRLEQGLITTELDQIRYWLDKHIYCCGVCMKYVNGYCVITNKEAELEWICKSFVPKEEFVHLELNPGNERSASYRYLSETWIRKENDGEDKKARNEDREIGSQENIDSVDLYEEGVALYRQGKLWLALEVFDSVLSESPQHFAALFHSGNSLLKLKCYEEALETFEVASGIKPGHAGLWANMGYAFMKLERLRQSLEAFERSISLNPVQKNAWEGKEVVISRIRQCEADLEKAKNALEANPSDDNALFEIGKLHMRLGELDQACEAFEKALRIKPENYNVWQLKGKVLFEKGFEKEALHALEKAIKYMPDFPEAWYEKGKVFLKLDNPKSAENAFKLAADLWENKGLKKKAEIARQRVGKLHSGRK